MKLIVLEGPAARQEYEIVQPLAVIGRAPDCDVMLFDAQVSRHHARLTLVDGGYVVENLQHDNPTIVNDRYLEGRHRLADGDLLVVGGVVLEAEIEKPAARTGWAAPADDAAEAETVPRSSTEAAREAIRAVAGRLADAGRRIEVRAAARPAGATGLGGADAGLAAILADHEALGGDAELARLAGLLSERLGNRTDIGALYRLGAETSALITWSRIAQRSIAEATRLAAALRVR